LVKISCYSSPSYVPYAAFLIFSTVHKYMFQTCTKTRLWAVGCCVIYSLRYAQRWLPSTNLQFLHWSSWEHLTS